MKGKSSRARMRLVAAVAGAAVAFGAVPCGAGEDAAWKRDAVLYLSMSGAAGQAAEAGKPLAADVAAEGVAANIGAADRLEARFVDAAAGKTVTAGDVTVNADNRSALQSKRKNGGTPLLTLPDAPALRMEDFTVELLARIDKAPAWGTVIGKRRANNQFSWLLQMNGNKGTLRARVDSNPEGASNKTGFNQGIGGNETPIADNQWHHFAATYDSLSQQFVLYVDYREAGKAKVPLPLVYDQEPLVVFQNFDGAIDELRLTAAVLAPDKFLRAQP